MTCRFANPICRSALDSQLGTDLDCSPALLFPRRSRVAYTLPDKNPPPTHLFSNSLPLLRQSLTSTRLPKNTPKNATGRSVCLYPPQPMEGVFPQSPAPSACYGVLSRLSVSEAGSLGATGSRRRSRVFSLSLCHLGRKNRAFPNFSKIALLHCAQAIASSEPLRAARFPPPRSPDYSVTPH
jgi:hypothetical protein